MDSSFSPSITSFVIRFILDEPADAENLPVQRNVPRQRRIVVRHVQSDQEISCAHWADVVAFVGRFVPLDGES